MAGKACVSRNCFTVVAESLRNCGNACGFLEVVFALCHMVSWMWSRKKKFFGWLLLSLVMVCTLSRKALHSREHRASSLTSAVYHCAACAHQTLSYPDNFSLWFLPVLTHFPSPPRILLLCCIFGVQLCVFLVLVYMGEGGVSLIYLKTSS